jgi:bile acid:Na+ symporter, BASS family
LDRFKEASMVAGSALRIALDFAGRHGPLMLLGGVLIGLIAPPLADAARPLFGLAVFVFTLGAFLKVDWPSFRAELASPLRVGLVLAWTTVGVPVSTFVLVAASGCDAELGNSIVLAMMAPPAGSAAAVAAMLGLSAPLALLAMLAATVVAPFTLPALAIWFTGAELAIDPVAMVGRLLMIIGGACLAAILLRRFAGRFVAGNPHAVTGIAVVGLILAAVGAMDGMSAVIVSRPSHVAGYLLLAFAMNAGFQLVGAMLFCWLDCRRSLTVGLVSGNRSVTLIWAAVGEDLLAHPEVELYLAMSLLPIFVLPAATRWIIARSLREPQSMIAIAT